MRTTVLNYPKHKIFLHLSYVQNDMNRDSTISNLYSWLKLKVRAVSLLFFSFIKKNVLSFYFSLYRNNLPYREFYLILLDIW